MENMTCNGFLAAGIHAGLKKNRLKDLGLLMSEVPATVAGAFTRNQVVAAPVRVTRQRVKSGVCRAVIVNSGNANCCTGEQGMADALQMARETATSLSLHENEILVASTGVIGEPLPMEKIGHSIPTLTTAVSPNGFNDFGEAIMTTDTRLKVSKCQGQIDNVPYTVLGTAKGAGMIKPDMATMLCFVCTDLAVPAEVLDECLKKGVDRSFNKITIDGDTSTNDMVLLMANGTAGVGLDPGMAQFTTHLETFQGHLDQVLHELALAVVKDGEGATKLVEIGVKGARSMADARKIAETVAHSNLVKTALFGEDANWGRIIGAVGRAGVPVDPDAIDILFDDVLMVKDGMGLGKEKEGAATRIMKKEAFAIWIDIHQGQKKDSVWTCDFSVDYVKINADYRS